MYIKSLKHSEYVFLFVLLEIALHWTYVTLTSFNWLALEKKNADNDIYLDIIFLMSYHHYVSKSHCITQYEWQIMLSWVLLFLNFTNITPWATVKVLVNSSVGGKRIRSICCLAADVKAEWLGGSGVCVSNGRAQISPRSPHNARCSTLSEPAELHVQRRDAPYQADGNKASSGHVVVGYTEPRTVEYIFKFSIKALANV